jgi:hypothetical protein
VNHAIHEIQVALIAMSAQAMVVTATSAHHMVAKSVVADHLQVALHLAK